MSTTFIAQSTTTTTLLSITGDCAKGAGPTEPSTTKGADGTVNFENDNYKVKVGDTGEINVTNKQTGETYRVWGDPHLDIDGKHAFDFWGTTTLNLDDGTKITTDTTLWRDGNNGATIASKVTIVDGQSDYAVRVTGVDDNKTGDLNFNETSKGWLTDAMVDDGNVIHENPTGTGFVALDDCGNVRKVDQNWVSSTDLVKNDGREPQDGNLDADLNKLVDQFAKMINIFSGIVAIRFLGMTLSGMQGNDDQGNQAAPKQNRGNNEVKFSMEQSTTTMNWNDGDVSMNFERRTFDFTFSRQGKLFAQ
jgi:hypothetical protein